ncbi:MAG: hypothetical protein EP321_03260 [Sphingomonadales bacterium]|nr:MAG: hypothetical protein EP345_09120 [Sphingomonadales bacterium]TNF05517.1 MAG: hypothetical protein EP321_03260 [Sphingomonadales bacterium]
MDSLRGQEEIEGNDAGDSGAIEAPPAISAQERRMHVRAYNYWVSLLGNRSLPSIEDLNPEDMEDFAANSVLLDFSMGLENPAIIYLGSALREECGIEGKIERAEQVPPRSLLSRLTDHYLQIIANAAPVGFEAEFTNQRGAEIMYRGILMPFSSNDETIDFIYGVINWKEVADKGLTEGLDEEIRAAMNLSPVASRTAPIWADGPSATADYEDEEGDAGHIGMGASEKSAFEESDFGFGDADEDYGLAPESGEGELDLSAFLDMVDTDQPLELELDQRVPDAGEAVSDELVGDLTAEDVLEVEDGVGPQDNIVQDGDDVRAPAMELTEPEAEPELEPMEAGVAAFSSGPEFDPDEMGSFGPPVIKIGLPAMLDMARRSAAEARDCDVRGRSALYSAISDAYDFTLSASEAPEDYEMMLEAAGITVQERSPMTAVIKLVFGVDHDKTRVAEYALALDYAVARRLPRGGLADELAAHEGGLKGLVRDMRAARKAGGTARPERRIERAVKKLGKARALDTNALPFDEHGLAVVVARREADGSVTLIAGVDLSDKAAQKVAITASELI